MKPFKEVEEEASYWLVREDRGLDTDARTALDAWLAQDTANRVAYLQLKAVWRRADRLAALRSPGLPVWRRARPTRSATMWRIAATVLFLAVAGAGGLYYYSQSATSYATGIGEIQTVRLSDGSRIELNTNTHLSARLTKSARTIRLDRGEAYFDVVHDAQRPFVVEAGNRRITDIGTKFTVRRQGDDVHVAVVEGRVRIEALHGANTDPVIANADDMLVSKRDGTLVVPTRSGDVQKATSWRRGLLIFNQATLAEAAEEFNRYNRRQLIVVGKARDIQIGGVFRANNLGAFAALVKTGLRLDVEDKDNTIVVSKP